MMWSFYEFILSVKEDEINITSYHQQKSNIEQKNGTVKQNANIKIF